MPRPIRSLRTASLVQSEIRAMTRACTERGGVNLGQGICDVPTPAPIKEAAYRAIAEDRSIYTRYDGDACMREALARKAMRDGGIAINPDNEAIVTIGASGAFAATLMALCNPGEEIILFEPFYGYHYNTALVAGLKPRAVPLAAPDFAIDFGALEATITPATRAIVVCTPCNPSGKVFTAEELTAILALCTKHDLLLITDEVYEYIVYPGARHVSPLSLPGARDRTVAIGSFSKTYNITGWRIGYVLADAALAQPIGLVNDLYYVCAPTPLQHAVAHALDTYGPEYYAELAGDYLAKRDQFCGVLKDIGLEPIVPRGAYYVLTDIGPLGAPTAHAAAMAILDGAGVAGVAGTAFHADGRGEHLVRFCYAKRQEDLDRACDQLLRWSRTR